MWKNRQQTKKILKVQEIIFTNLVWKKKEANEDEQTKWLHFEEMDLTWNFMKWNKKKKNPSLGCFYQILAMIWYILWKGTYRIIYWLERIPKKCVCVYI